MKSENRRGRGLRVLAFVLGILLVLALLLLGVRWLEKRQSADEWDYDVQEIRYGGKTYVYNDDVESMLVIGLDKYDQTGKQGDFINDRQADFLMLFVLDRKNETVTAYHINRDTMTDMNVLGFDGGVTGTAHQQLALSHTYGDGKKQSCRNVVDAVSNLLNQMPIDHYVSITMDGVPIFTDLVGGAEVTVMDDFTDIDSTLVQGETVTLTGKQALIYVRSRGSLEDSTNLHRMERQRQFLNALHTSAERAVRGNAGFAVDAYQKLSEYIVTNCSADRLQTWLEAVSKYRLTEIVSMQGEARVGGAAEQHMEFYPDEDCLMQDVLRLFYEEKK